MTMRLKQTTATGKWSWAEIRACAGIAVPARKKMQGAVISPQPVTNR
jgi:hypothetical protein